MKVNNFFYELNFLTKFSNLKYKKLRLLLSVLFINLSVGLDILIILIFSKYFSNQTSTDFLVVEYIFENMYIFPIIVVFRFLFFYLDKLNQLNFKENINKDLKYFTLNELYKSGRYSISDTNFYVNNVSSHVSFFYSALIQFSNNIIQFIIYFSFLIITNFNLLFTMSFIGLVLFIPTRFLLSKSRKFADLSYTTSKAIVGEIQKIIDNLLLIKVLKTHIKEFNSFQKRLNNLKNIETKNQIIKDFNASFPTFSITLILSFLISFFTVLKNLTLDFLGGILRLVQTIGQINGSLTSLVNSRVHLEKLTELIQENESSDEYQIIINEDLEKAIVMENIEFKYKNSEEPLFTNLNLEFEKYKHYVIVGPNGTGKSTLMGLIGGVLRPVNGTVNVCDDNLAYVGANSLIFENTVKANLVYGLEDKKVSDSVLSEYLNKFSVFEENNLDRVINNNSVSSGQSQKISFIRALLKEPEILLLDESTSNLDEDSKLLIRDILNKFENSIINVTHNAEDFDYDEKIDMGKLRN